MSKSKKIKPIGRQALYNMISCRAKELVDRLFELSKSSNDSVALGATKILVNKILPDIKNIEIQQVYTLENVKKIAEARSKNDLKVEEMLIY